MQLINFKFLIRSHRLHQHTNMRIDRITVQKLCQENRESQTSHTDKDESDCKIALKRTS